MSSIKNQLSGIKNRQQLLYILVFSMAAVGIWVGSSIFSSQTKTGIESSLQKLAQPLNPSINTDVLNRISAKRSFSDAELSGFGIFKVVSSRDGKQQRVVTIDVPDDILETQATTSSSFAPRPSLSDIPSSTATPAANPEAQFAPVLPAL